MHLMKEFSVNGAHLSTLCGKEVNVTTAESIIREFLKNDTQRPKRNKQLGAAAIADSNQAVALKYVAYLAANFRETGQLLLY
jgi:hypothetical protein